MRDKRIWIAFKAVLIILLVVYIFTAPSSDKFRIFLRLIMLIVFTYSIIRDIIEWKNESKKDS
jgi:hypothetical protein